MVLSADLLLTSENRYEHKGTHNPDQGEFLEAYHKDDGMVIEIISYFEQKALLKKHPLEWGI